MLLSYLLEVFEISELNGVNPRDNTVLLSGYRTSLEIQVYIEECK